MRRQNGGFRKGCENYLKFNIFILKFTNLEINIHL